MDFLRNIWPTPFKISKGDGVTFVIQLVVFVVACALIGWLIGVLAGMLNAIICTSTSALHGGFVLYNGGFTAGLTALVLLTVLDFYKVKVKHGDENKENA